MQAQTRRRPIDKMDAARLLGPPEEIIEVRRFAVSLGLSDIEDTIDYREAFPKFVGKEQPIAIKAYRTWEGTTQDQLAKLAGIPHRHISDVENGRRPIGKENVRKLTKALNADYGCFSSKPMKMKRNFFGELMQGTDEINQHLKGKISLKNCRALEEKDSYTVKELSPEMIWNSGGIAIRGGRGKEGLTQKQLAELVGIAQHHIREMANAQPARKLLKNLQRH